MAIELNIQGALEMTILHRDSLRIVSEELEKEILEKLQKQEYVIGIASLKIFDINNLMSGAYLYKIEIEPTDEAEYSFDSFWE